MNCTVLVDAARIARWKVECIELLKADHRVDVLILERRGSRAPALMARLLGGRALRRAQSLARRGAMEACELILDLRERGAPEPERFIGAAYWCFCESDGSLVGEMPGARRIAGGSTTFTIELCGRLDDDEFTALRAGTFKRLYTYARSLDVALGECKRWPALALRVLAASGMLPVNRRPPPHRAAAAPPALTLISQVARAFGAHLYSHLFVDARWNVGVVQGSPANFLSKEYRPQIRWLAEEPLGFLADPFLFASMGRRYILGERLDGDTRNGFITCIEIEKDGGVRAERAVVRSERHLSYPYIFEWGGAWYMVPESSQDRRVVLYRAFELPYEWRPVATLLDGVATCDNTILRYAGMWWLFCTHKSRDPNLNLFLYYSRELLGPWRPHIANPVKTDIGSSRPAGAPFVADGVLYRPGQDCARAYGDAITFNRVISLNEFQFAEETAATFGAGEADEKSQGVHTISYAGGLVALDSKTVVRASPRLIRRRLRELATRIVGRAS